MSQENEYDGIIENDNPMPTWWLWSFFITIIFGGIYFLHYASNTGDNSYLEFEKAWAHHHRLHRTKKSNQTVGLSFAEKMEKYSNNELAIITYQRVCQACHNEQMQGSIGPNLVDAFWIHGGRPEDVVKSIQEGFVEKGMPAWGEILKEEEIFALAIFIISKRGAQVPNPKDAQGVLFDEGI